MKEMVKGEISGNRFLKMGHLGSAEKQYAKEGKSKAEIAARLGNFCERKGWCHSAAMYYGKEGSPRSKTKILRLAEILEKEGRPDIARQIVILGNKKED
ncbi:MAG: hypothetical protein Q8R26_01885 [bacterium]|nr:hypothetical protein [bacterium]